MKPNVVNRVVRLEVESHLTSLRGDQMARAQMARPVAQNFITRGGNSQKVIVFLKLQNIECFCQIRRLKNMHVNVRINMSFSVVVRISPDYAS